MKPAALNTEQRALEATKRRNENHSDFVVGSVVPRYLDGTLYIVLFKDSGGIGFENYAFVPDATGEVEVYRNSSQLAHAVSTRTRTHSLAEKLLNVGGISGIIAIGITATICYMAIASKGDLKVPDILSSALTLILGFYFGSKTHGK